MKLIVKSIGTGLVVTCEYNGNASGYYWNRPHWADWVTVTFRNGPRSQSMAFRPEQFEPQESVFFLPDRVHFGAKVCFFK